MDTTLRDGEQTPDVAYTAAEKLQLARLMLEDVRRGPDRDRVDARVRGRARGREAHHRLGPQEAHAPGSRSSATATAAPRSTGSSAPVGRVMNLLVKGSERHCREPAPRSSPRPTASPVAETDPLRARKRLRVNVYLEDWSNGVRDSFDYVFAMVQLLRAGVARIYLPDTLGVFAPDDVDSLRRPDDLATWPDVVLRVPRPQRLRARHRELPGGGPGRRARRPHQRERHGRARGQHEPRRGGGRRSRPHEASARRGRVASWPQSRSWSRPSAARTWPPTRRSWAATSSPRRRASTPTATPRATSTRAAWRRRASDSGGATPSASSRERHPWTTT